MSSNIIAASIAGATTSFLTLPLDVIKTKKQVLEKYSKLNSYLVMQNILKNEGIKGLYTGAKPRIMKVMIHCTLMLSMYEGFINYSMRY